jgi:hypothetical protein
MVMGVAAERGAAVDHENSLVCLRRHAFCKDGAGKPCANHQPVVLSMHAQTVCLHMSSRESLGEDTQR